MSDRQSSARAAVRGLAVAVDVAVFTLRSSELMVGLAPAASAGRARQRWALPSAIVVRDESPDVAAKRTVRLSIGIEPALVEQATVRGGSGVATGIADLVITYFGLATASESTLLSGAEWRSIGDLPVLEHRHRDAIEIALAAVRTRVDDHPIAFRLLPASFTLSELQLVYELLLGRPLHKASFRRSLHAAALVEPMDEWRSEGRGRPAQLFRYAPKRRKRVARGVRFDLLA